MIKQDLNTTQNLKLPLATTGKFMNPFEYFNGAMEKIDAQLTPTATPASDSTQPFSAGGAQNLLKMLNNKLSFVDIPSSQFPITTTNNLMIFNGNNFIRNLVYGDFLIAEFMFDVPLLMRFNAIVSIRITGVSNTAPLVFQKEIFEPSACVLSVTLNVEEGRLIFPPGNFNWFSMYPNGIITLRNLSIATSRKTLYYIDRGSGKRIELLYTQPFTGRTIPNEHNFPIYRRQNPPTKRVVYF